MSPDHALLHEDIEEDVVQAEASSIQRVLMLKTSLSWSLSPCPAESNSFLLQG